MSQNESPQMKIAELNRRMLAGENVTDDEIIEGIQLLRADRKARTQVKKNAETAKAATENKGEDVLKNLI